MGIVTGYCTLVLDGHRLEKVRGAIEVLGGADQPSYGFVSGPLEALNRVATAKYVQIELDDGRILDGRVLQVHPTGLALVTLKARQA
jgi:hypothetical protein